MKRYIVDKRAAIILGIDTCCAMDTLKGDIITGDECMHFNNLPFISLPLTDEQIEILHSNDIFPNEEVTVEGVTLGSDYERIRSSAFKTKKKGVTGRGVKVGIIDSGCATAVVPVDFGVNFSNSAQPGVTDIFNHGTRVASIIKHPVIGLAPDCEFHVMKSLNDSGSLQESWALAAFDYAIDNNLDFVNISWSFVTDSINTAIQAVIDNGTVICAATGNNTTDSTISIPAGLNRVVAVNAITESGSPHYKNILYGTGGTTHGVTVACGGVSAEGYTNSGVYSIGTGTSFSSPFFVGLLACYKEELQEEDNFKVLEYALLRAKKTTQSTYFGAGIASF